VLVVRKNVFGVVGTGSVAICDNVKHEGDTWYYWLKSGTSVSSAPRGLMVSLL
jgi:hypothetical protein